MSNEQEPAPGDKYLERRLLGENWSNYVGCSRFSIFWRASRLNHLRPYELPSVLGIKIAYHECPFDKLTHDASSPDKMLSLSPDREIDPSQWPVHSWWPFGGEIPWGSMPWHLRICPACARYCYHSLLFQMPGVQYCPWHRVALIETCPRCKQSLLIGRSVTLRPGTCLCGHDLVDHLSTITGDSATLPSKRRAISEFRTEAEESRRNNYLIAPRQWDTNAWKALHAFATDRVANTTRIIIDRISLSKYECRNWCKFITDIVEYHLGEYILSLPMAWHLPLANLLVGLIQAMPISARQQMACDPYTKYALREIAPFLGIDCTHLPTHHIHIATLEILQQLALVIYQESPIKRHPLGWVMTRRAIQRVLLRAHSFGARATLASHCTEWRDSRPDVMVAQLPWVLLSLSPNRVPSGRIAWTRQSS